MAALDRETMKLIILELEADGADHDGAQIDAHVARILSASARELSEVHAKTNRGIFANHVDWAKAHLTEAKLHEKVGESNGQNVYRITPQGRDVLAKEKHRQALFVRAYGRGKGTPT